jgi:pyruvate dehydrogenase E1 component beta subunit
MLHRALDVAQELADEGISVEVVDPRSLLPLDRNTILDSVIKTGRLVIVEEDTITYGWGAEIAATVAEQALGYLDAPVLRVATPDVPMPAAPNLEKSLVPDQERIKRAIYQVLGR